MKTRTVVGIALLVSAVMALCPPYVVVWTTESGKVTKVVRYVEVWNDPTVRGFGESATLNYSLFDLQLGLVWAAAGAVILLSPKKKES